MKACRVYLIVCLLTVLTACGATTGAAGGGGASGDSQDAAPGGAGTTLVPIELPSAIAIGVSEHAGSNVAVPLSDNAPLENTAKAGVPGSNTVQQGLYPINQINTQLDNAFGLLKGIALDGSTSGSNDNGDSYSISYAASTFTAFTDQNIGDVNCSATCSGDGTTVPVCATVTLNGQAFWKGVLTTLPDSSGNKGAGCFRMAINNTTSSALSTILNGTKNLFLSGVWDHSDLTTPKTELYWNTSGADANNVKITGAHAYLTEANASTTTSNGAVAKASAGANVVTAKLNGMTFVSGDNTNYLHEGDNVFERGSGKNRSSWRVGAAEISDQCLTTSGSSTSGCESTATTLSNLIDSALRDDCHDTEEGVPETNKSRFFASNEMNDTDPTQHIMRGEQLDAADTFAGQFPSATIRNGLLTASSEGATIYGALNRLASMTIRSDKVGDATTSTDTMAVSARIVVNNLTTDGETIYFFVTNYAGGFDTVPTSFGLQWGGASQNTPANYSRLYTTGTTDFVAEEVGDTTYAGTSLCVCITRNSTVWDMKVSEDCVEPYASVTSAQKTIPTSDIANDLEVVFAGIATGFNTLEMSLDYIRFEPTATCPSL